MRQFATSLVLTSILCEGAFATFSDWRQAPSFSCPQNTNNVCNSVQQGGFNFTDLPLGSFSSYGSFSFNGFSCKDSSATKRGLPLKKRGSDQFGGKCISATVSKSPGPSFSCGQSNDFSPSNYYVSADRDVQIEFQYTMGDGSSCSHVSSCQAGGSQISNTQCGGAKSVTFKLPETEGSDCGINIHGIGFDCSPPVAPPPSSKSSAAPAPPTSSAPSSHPPASSPPASSPPASSPPASYPSSVIASPVPSTPAQHAQCPDILPQCLNTWIFTTSCKDNTDCSCYCKDDTFISSVYGCLSAWGLDNTELQAAISYLVGVCAEFIPSNPGIITNCPSSIPIAPTSPPPTSVSGPTVSVTTAIVDTTITTCPVGATVTSANRTTVLQSAIVSTAYVTRTILTCDKCGAAPPTAPLTTITIPALSTTCTVPRVTFATTTAAGGSTAVILAPTGSPGSGTVTAGVYNQPGPTGLKTSAGYNNVTATPGPQQFQGAASKLSSSWIAGTIFTLICLVFAL